MCYFGLADILQGEKTFSVTGLRFEAEPFLAQVDVASLRLGFLT